MEYCDTCKLDTNHGGYEFCPSETKAKLDAALLQFEEAREIIAEVSYSPEFKKWFYHGQEQDPCGVHAFTKKYAVKAEPAMVCLEGCPLPAGWDGSPKGCWVQHPLTREICQLPPDGHTIHERDDANGTRLLRWGPEKPKVERSPYAPNLDYPGKPVAEKPNDGYPMCSCGVVLPAPGISCAKCGRVDLKRIPEPPKNMRFCWHCGYEAAQYMAAGETCEVCKNQV